MNVSKVDGTVLVGVRSKWIDGVAEVNRELWLILSLFIIAGLLNWLVASHGMILGFYTIPTLFSAYVYGRRHAVLTAIASILLVVIACFVNPTPLVQSNAMLGEVDQWCDVGIWGGLLTITAYTMGTLHERKETHVRELRRTYFGEPTILQQFISNDKYTHNHSYRVALYASLSPAAWGLTKDELTIFAQRLCCTTSASSRQVGKFSARRRI